MKGGLRQPGQRTAVKLRPHQETTSWQIATSEPVVLHHGRERGGGRARRGAAVSFNSLWGSLAQEFDSPPTMRARQFD